MQTNKCSSLPTRACSLEDGIELLALVSVFCDGCAGAGRAARLLAGRRVLLAKHNAVDKIWTWARARGMREGEACQQAHTRKHGLAASRMWVKPSNPNSTQSQTQEAQETQAQTQHTATTGQPGVSSEKAVPHSEHLTHSLWYSLPLICRRNCEKRETGRGMV